MDGRGTSGTLSSLLVVLSLFLFLSSYPKPSLQERTADGILEWQYVLDCPDRGLKGYVTAVKGIKNANEWECERLTTTSARETSSCVPSQFTVAPLIISRPLTKNSEMWDWRDLVADGQLTDARTNCSINMFERGYTKSSGYFIYNAWPASVSIKPYHGTMKPFPDVEEEEEGYTWTDDLIPGKQVNSMTPFV